MHQKEDYRIIFVALTDANFTEGRNLLAVNWNTDDSKLHKKNGT